MATLTQTATPVPDNAIKDAGYVSRWKTTKPVPFSPESLLDLLEGRTPLLKEEKFLDEGVADRFAEILEPSFSPYLYVTGPAIHKVGLAQFEFQAQAKEDFSNRKGDEKDRYFAAVEEVKDTHKNLAAQTGVDLLQKVIDHIASFMPADWEVALAQEPDGRQYYSGTFRGINRGLPIHCDWAPYDTMTEDWAIANVTNQCSFNLYLSDFDEGSTIVHDVQWTPEALEFRDPATYAYFPALVEGKLEAKFKPEKGDLYIFNSRNMHHLDEVSRSCPRRRVAVSSFFGVLPPQAPGEKTKLIFWS